MYNHHEKTEEGKRVLIWTSSCPLLCVLSNFPHLPQRRDTDIIIAGRACPSVYQTLILSIYIDPLRSKIQVTGLQTVVKSSHVVS